MPIQWINSWLLLVAIGVCTVTSGSLVMNSSCMSNFTPVTTNLVSFIWRQKPHALCFTTHTSEADSFVCITARASKRGKQCMAMVCIIYHHVAKGLYLCFLKAQGQTDRRWQARVHSACQASSLSALVVFFCLFSFNYFSAFLLIYKTGSGIMDSEQQSFANSRQRQGSCTVWHGFIKGLGANDWLVLLGQICSTHHTNALGTSWSLSLPYEVTQDVPTSAPQNLNPSHMAVTWYSTEV